MIRHRERVRVKVPATTSNLGPGFDVLGMALKLHNEIELELLPSPGYHIEIDGEGAATIPLDETNLAVKTLQKCIAGRQGARLKLINRIPLARGLGSSAATRLGVIMAVEALRGKGSLHAGEEAVLEFATRLEGHPDNVVPAFYGGLCASMKNSEGLKFLRLNVPKDLVAVVCVPAFELSTEKARAVLPKQISREDAVATSGRVAFLVAALEHKRYDLLKMAMQDVLHQPYRRPLVPGMQRVIDGAVDTGAFGAALSGAGPTILALARRGPKTALIGRAMQRAFFRINIESRYHVLEIEKQGASARLLK